MHENQVQLVNIVAFGVSKKTKINAKLDERILIVSTEETPTFRLLSAHCGCKQWHELQNNIWYSCRALEKCSEHSVHEHFAYFLMNRIPTIMFGVEMDDETGKPKYDRPKKAEPDESLKPIPTRTKPERTERAERTKENGEVKSKNKVSSAPVVLTSEPASVAAPAHAHPPASSSVKVEAKPTAAKNQPHDIKTQQILSNKVDVNDITQDALIAYISKETKFHAPTALNRKNDAGEMMFVVRFKVSEDKISQIGDSYLYLYGAPYSKVLEMSKAIAREITKMTSTKAG